MALYDDLRGLVGDYAIEAAAPRIAALDGVARCDTPTARRMDVEGAVTACGRTPSWSPSWPRPAILILTGDDGMATELDCNGEMVAVPVPFPAEGVTCDLEVNSRYRTGFDRDVPVESGGPRHGVERNRSRAGGRARCRCRNTQLVAAGSRCRRAARRSGVVCNVTGTAFIWETRRRSKAEVVPDTIPEAMIKDNPRRTPASV